MRPTTETLAPFIGGQLEIQNRTEDYLFRGEIARVEVVDGNVKVRFAWLARNDGTPIRPNAEWTASDRFDYEASLEIYSVREPDQDGRVFMMSNIVDELGVFFPRGYAPHGEPCQLDRSKVKGLAPFPRPAFIGCGPGGM